MITYKFPIDTTGTATITRGSDYYVIFDQNNTDVDDLATTTGTGSLEDLSLNMTDAITVPYVDTPATVAVTSYAKTTGATAKIKFAAYDAAGEILPWWGQVTTSPALDGYDGVSVYNVASNSISASDTPCTGPSALATDGKGTVTATYTGLNTAYAYMKLTTTAGVFAKDSEAVTTELVETVGNPATAVELKQDSTDPTAAVVKFDSLTKRASGTVYVFESNATLASATNTDIVGQDKDGLWMVGSAPVEGGTAKVTIPGVFNKYQIGAGTTGANAYEDQFAALFVPDETDYYASMTTATFKLDNTVESYALSEVVDGKTAAAIGGITNLIKGVNKFGDQFTLDATTGAGLATAALAATPLKSTATAVASNDTLACAIAAVGTVTLTPAAGTDGAMVKGTYQEVTLPTGQKLTITCAANSAPAASTWKLSL